MGKNLLALAHTFNINKLQWTEVTELTSSKVHENAWAILLRQESRGVPIASSYWKFIFNVLILSILTEFTVKTL